MKVLIDGDIVLYRCCFAAEHTRYRMLCNGKEYWFDNKTDLNNWVKDMDPEEYEWESTLEIEPLNFVLSTVKHAIDNIITATKADDYVIYLSGKNNFRKDIATLAKYKGNRDNKRTPVHLKEAQEYLRKYFKVESNDLMEADDLLADAQTDDTVIASIDKDLLQIPGKHYNFVRNEKILVTQDTALRNLMEQMLVGDSTDNIPGIYRCGPVKAAKILEGCETYEQMYTAVAEAWREYLSGDNAPDWVLEVEVVGDHYPEAMYLCKQYTGEEVWYSIDEILEEIQDLLQVGGHEFGETNKATGT